MKGLGRTGLALPAALLLAAAVAREAPAQDAAEIVGRAGRVYRNLTSLGAEFEQIIEDRAQGDTLIGRGTVIQAGPNLFAMRFTEPAGEAIVVDGSHIWIYTPSTAPNQVTRSPVPANPVYGVNLLAALLDRPRERYDATYLRRDTLGGRAVNVVELVPRSDDVGFRKAVLWLGADDSLPRRIDLDEAPGLRRILTLTALRPNAPHTRKTFTFEVPAGVRVVKG